MEMNRGELQLALRAIKARKHREQIKLVCKNKTKHTHVYWFTSKATKMILTVLEAIM